jgi:ATP-dependent DNA helicase Rep
VQGIPSRFISEMKLHEVSGAKEDPRAKLKALREAAASRAAQSNAADKKAADKDRVV